MLDKGMQTIKRSLIWLSRINHCKGFGIQSPWAYHMACDVINGHEPHDIHDELSRRYRSTGAINRKLCGLCRRLSSRMSPQVIINVDSDGRMTGDYLKAGCREAGYIEVPCETCEDSFRQMLEGMEGTKLIRIAPQGNFDRLFMAACGQARTGSAIMLTGIHTVAGARRLWEYAVKELPRTVTFDLYYCGLIFFDDKRFKQNYIINF